MAFKTPGGLQRIVLLLFLPFLSIAVANAAQDAPIALAALPAAVRQSVVKAYPGGVISEAGKRTRKGEIIFYSASVKMGHKSFDVYLDPNGTILQTANSVHVKHLPDPIVATAKLTFPSGVITEGERDTDYKTGAITYCIEVMSGGKVVELEMDPTGKVLSRENLSGDE